MTAMQWLNSLRPALRRRLPARLHAQERQVLRPPVEVSATTAGVLVAHDGSEMPLANYDKMPTAWKLLRPCSRRRKHKGSME